MHITVGLILRKKKRYLRAESVQFFLIDGESKFVIILENFDRVHAFRQLLSLITVLGLHHIRH